MKRKLLILCLVGAAVFNFSACGSDAGADADGTEGTVQESEQNAEDDSEVTEEDAPEIHTEETRVSDRPDYVGIQDLDIEEYVTLGDYANMTVEIQTAEITDDTIEGIINSSLMRVTKGEVKTGDIVNIDYSGKRDGVAFAGGTSNGYELEIGSGTFIPGFEDGLIGVSVGETVDLELTFPEDYRNTELAGVDVVFTVTVNSIAVQSDYASVTDEELQSLGMDYDSKEELWDAGAELAEQEARAAYDVSVKSAALNKVVEESTIISVPDYLIEEEVESYFKYMNTFCQAIYGIDWETYVRAYYGINTEDFREQITDESWDSVAAYLVYEAVARAEGITVTDEQVAAQADMEAADYGYSSGDELIEEVGYTAYRMYMVQELIADRLSELVTVEETKIAVQN